MEVRVCGGGGATPSQRVQGQCLPKCDTATQERIGTECLPKCTEPTPIRIGAECARKCNPDEDRIGMECVPRCAPCHYRSAQDGITCMEIPNCTP